MKNSRRNRCPSRVGFFVTAALIWGVLAVVQPVAADPLTDEICEADLGPPVTAAEASSGTLLLETEQTGLYVAAPTVRTEVELQVHGVVVRGRVRQTFRNPTVFWVEGRYVFPLPDNAAVDRLRMIVGDRVIEGEIQERAQAEETYQQAKLEGKKASLVEQHRPNVFSAQVANMGPGEEIVVEIGYLQTLRWVDGGYRLRFPTVVAPRYGGVPPESGVSPNPRVVLPCEDTVGNGRLAPGNRSNGTLDLEVELAAGGPLATLDSSHHAVEIERVGGGSYRVRLAETEVTDRDFELVWTPERQNDASARVFVEEREGSFYTLLMVYPPREELAAGLSLPRESVFVIDTSGSMHGESLAQAQRALTTALERLRPEDSFNVIQFNNRAHRLFDQAVPVGRRALEQALDYVAGLEADGGTNIRAALAAALAGDDVGYPVRQIVFITDGAVGNESEIFAELESQLGESRLFTVGIGSAPNSYFMRKAAQLGRGTFTHIGSIAQVEERMAALFAKLESPVLTDLVADWGDPLIEAFPSRVPDLYAGEPLVVIGRGSTPLEGLTLSGARGVLPWNVSLTLPPAAGEAGIAKLWARRKLGALSDALLGHPEPDLVHAEATTVALDYGLVSRYTSLVAVDHAPSRPEDEAIVTRRIPLHLPAGWTHPGFLGGLPQTAAGVKEWQLAGLLCLVLAAVVAPHRRRRVRA